MSELVWVLKGGDYHLNEKQKNTIKKIEPAVYELQPNMFGFHLSPISERFEFPYKIYGLETDLIKRALKYYNNTDSGNLGILLNGVKGTGKTVTSKILCNELNLPVILVPRQYDNAQSFINSIPQDIIVFVDEYEKIYKDSHELLTIMDGAMNSQHRRVFLMTTNNLYIDPNLIDRPSRIRYLKTFGNLSPDVVEEIVDDVLIHKEFKDDCITFASTLEIITVDIVKSIINEVNIQEESPLTFKNVFNASVKKGKYKVFTEIDNKVELFVKGAKVSPRINFGDHSIGSSFYINDVYVGSVKEVLDFNTVKVEIYEDEVEVEENDTLEKLVEAATGQKPKRGRKTKKSRTEIKTPLDLPRGEINFVVQEDYSFNETYRYGKRDFAGYDEYGFM